MRIFSVLLSGLLASSLSGCSYDYFVQRDMKIPYVFVPPSRDFTPYSIVAYNEEENFQTVCPTSILIEQMSMDDFVKTYLDDSKGKPVASLVLQPYFSPMMLAMSDETIMGRCKER
ncbi:hypothetical protein [Ralstonia pseudosolanacearum]|uniref:hypothetical protein n=1 Tax=Ralstonia pseudosolanacearum TaxID=1310165 RepID=UPI003390A61A